MNVNNITKYAVGLLIGVVLIAGLIMPVVDASLHTAGDSVVKYNNPLDIRYNVAPAGEIVIAEYTSGTFSINGDAIPTNIGDARPIVLVSDVCIIAYAEASNSYELYLMTSMGANAGAIFDPASPTNYKLIFDNGTLTAYRNDENIRELEYTWLYTYAENGAYTAMASIGTTGRTVYVKDINDIFGSGWYSSGENDTYYSYHMGEAIANAGYEATISYDLVTAPGTTDIKQIDNFKVNIGGESFVPYWSLVPVSVEGHADSGANYSLLSIIPYLAIIGLVVFAASVIKNKRL